MRGQSLSLAQAVTEQQLAYPVVDRHELQTLSLPVVLLNRVLVLLVDDLLLERLQLLSELVGRLLELLAHVNTFLVLEKKATSC